jgi:NhaP-type Na+/H+ or K+/H+ antiporter
MLEKPAPLYAAQGIATFMLFVLIAVVLISLLAVSQASPDSTMGDMFIGWIEGLGFDPETYSYHDAGYVLGTHVFFILMAAGTSLSISYRWRNVAIITPALWAFLSCTNGGACGGLMALACLACILAAPSQAYLKGEDADATPPTPGVY